VGSNTRLVVPLATAIWVPVVAAIVVSVAFFMLGIAATFADKAAIRAHVAEAFDDGELAEVLAPPIERGRVLRPYNDCLVLSMLLAHYESRLDQVLFPQAPFGFGAGPCAYLHEIARGRDQAEAKRTLSAIFVWRPYVACSPGCGLEHSRRAANGLLGKAMLRSWPRCWGCS